MVLSQTDIGSKTIVTHLQLSDNHQRRMMDLGLMPGTEVQVVRKAPMGDPIVVQFRGYQISMRVSEASRIQVQPAL